MLTLRSSLPLSLFVLTSLLGCPADDTGTSATTNPTTTTATETGTGDGDPGDGDGDPGDGDGDPGDGDGFCVHNCTTDADCLIEGEDQGLTCVDNHCQGDFDGCRNDQECVALYSGWSTPCTAGGGECDDLAQVCLDIGLCATPPSDIIECDVLNMEEIMTTDIDGNPVTVCAQPDAVCNDDNFCFVPCESDDDCISDAFPSCNVDTGVCQCTSDADCATINMAHLSVCNAGSCGCNADQQCVDGNAGDICTTEGYCGCSGDMACANVASPFDGGMFACEQL